MFYVVMKILDHTKSTANFTLLYLYIEELLLLPRWHSEQKQKSCQVVKFSRELEYAIKLCEGMDCTFKFGDYRRLHKIYPQKFDAITLIGATEHIGYKNYKGLSWNPQLNCL